MGKRNNLGVAFALGEHEIHWRAFMEQLVQRGLTGIRMITSDDRAGLRAARKANYGGVPWQRCQFHIWQIALASVPRDAMKAEVTRDIKAILKSIAQCVINGRTLASERTAMDKDTHTQHDVWQQRLDEWEKIDEDGYRYHKAQWETPKQSTIAFVDFAATHISKSTNIIDMGAGAGASTASIANEFQSVSFTAFDYSAELTQLGSKIAIDKGIQNLTFEQGDWFNMKETTMFDGCISLQTLSWLPNIEMPLKAIFKNINPNWIAVTSLFYEGDITCRIEVEEHITGKKSFYNIYSIPAVSRLCEQEGFTLVTAVPFEIGIDIEKPNNLDKMGTYTRTLAGKNNTNERIQVSGPLLMNWYMLLIEKSQPVQQRQ